MFITEQKRREAIVAANDLTQALVDHLNVGYVINKHIGNTFKATD